MSTPRSPDYQIKAMTRPGSLPLRLGRIGAGWSNPDGSISIKLDPFVVISAADDLIITVFPIDRARSEDRKESP